MGAAAVPVVERWFPAKYTNRDVVPAFAALAWYAKQVKSVTAVKAGFKKAHCTSDGAVPPVYTCTTEQDTWLETVSQKICEAAGRTYASKSCDDAAQPGTSPGTGGAASTSP